MYNVPFLGTVIIRKLFTALPQLSNQDFCTRHKVWLKRAWCTTFGDLQLRADPEGEYKDWPAMM